MSSNCMSLNPSKTEFLIYSLPQQLYKFNNPTFHLLYNIILSHVVLLAILVLSLIKIWHSHNKSLLFLNYVSTTFVFLTLTWSDMFYSHKGPMGGKLPPGISQLPDEIESKFQWLSPIFEDGHSNRTNGIPPDVTGSGNSKMAVYELVLSIYCLVDEIERRLQRKTQYLICPKTQGENGDNLNFPRLHLPSVHLATLFATAWYNHIAYITPIKV